LAAVAAGLVIVVIIAVYQVFIGLQSQQESDYSLLIRYKANCEIDSLKTKEALVGIIDDLMPFQINFLFLL